MISFTVMILAGERHYFWSLDTSFALPFILPLVFNVEALEAKDSSVIELESGNQVKKMLCYKQKVWFWGSDQIYVSI